METEYNELQSNVVTIQAKPRRTAFLFLHKESDCPTFQGERPSNLHVSDDLWQGLGNSLTESNNKTLGHRNLKKIIIVVALVAYACFYPDFFHTWLFVLGYLGVFSTITIVSETVIRRLEKRRLRAIIEEASDDWERQHYSPRMREVQQWCFYGRETNVLIDFDRLGKNRQVL